MVSVLKIKDIEKAIRLLKNKGYKVDFNLFCEKEFYDIDLKDNRSYMFVNKKTGIIEMLSGSYGDCPADYYDKQLIPLYFLIKENLIEVTERHNNIGECNFVINKEK